MGKDEPKICSDPAPFRELELIFGAFFAAHRNRYLRLPAAIPERKRPRVAKAATGVSALPSALGRSFFGRKHPFLVCVCSFVW